MAISLSSPARSSSRFSVSLLRLRLLRRVSVWHAIYPYLCIAGIALLVLGSVVVIHLYQRWKIGQKPPALL